MLKQEIQKTLRNFYQESSGEASNSHSSYFLRDTILLEDGQVLCNKGAEHSGKIHGCERLKEWEVEKTVKDTECVEVRIKKTPSLLYTHRVVYSLLRKNRGNKKFNARSKNSEPILS